MLSQIKVHFIQQSGHDKAELIVNKYVTYFVYLYLDSV